MNVLQLIAAAALLLVAAATAAAESSRVTLSLRDVEISEAMGMLAKQQRLNILLSEGVEGSLSLNLYDVPVADAVQAIANAAGYAVERRKGAYFVLEHEKVGLYSNGNLTQVRSFNIHYADPESLEQMLEPYVSRYGKIKAIPERKLILVSDKPEFLSRIATLVRHADAKPRQVIIEAQILEISLNDEDSYGIDWTRLFDSQDGSGNLGLQGLAGAGGSSSSGFFFDFVNPNVDVVLTALRQEGRVRTLSTPKLVALDNQEAEVIIGDRRGYQVTTTINQVTSESIEFLESGVILRVTPHIDDDGRVLMDIHPEVSTGTVDAAGIPSQTTTEVTTSLLVPGGETVFIGGLMKHSTSQSYRRMPVLGRIPLLKVLFSSREETQVNTETIVLITPRLVGDMKERWNTEPVEKIDRLQKKWEEDRRTLDGELDQEEGDLLGVRPLASALLEREEQELVEGDEIAVAVASEHVAQATATALNVRDKPSVVAGAQPRLEDLPGSYYTVQLMSMSSREQLDAYLAKHGINGLPTVRITRGNGVAHALLLGVYESFAAAQEAALERPAALSAEEPWIRRLSSVQTDMRRASAKTNAGSVAEAERLVSRS